MTLKTPNEIRDEAYERAAAVVDAKADTMKNQAVDVASVFAAGALYNIAHAIRALKGAP